MFSRPARNRTRREWFWRPLVDHPHEPIKPHQAGDLSVPLPSVAVDVSCQRSRKDVLAAIQTPNSIKLRAQSQAKPQFVQFIPFSNPQVPSVALKEQPRDTMCRPFRCGSGTSGSSTFGTPRRSAALPRFGDRSTALVDVPKQRTPLRCPERGSRFLQPLAQGFDPNQKVHFGPGVLGGILNRRAVFTARGRDALGPASIMLPSLPAHLFNEAQHD